MSKFIAPGLILLPLLLTWSCRSDRQAEAERPQVQFKQTENTVYARLPAEPDGLNPFTTTSGYSSLVYYHIFQPLLTFDPETYALTPMLAVDVPRVEEISEGQYAGGTTYTYEINPRATWEDGSPVTAADVVFTYKALFNPKVNSAPHRGYVETVRDIQVDPDNARRFTIITDGRYILAEAGISNLSIYPKKFYDPNGLLDNVPLTQLLDPEQATQLAESDSRLQQFADAFNDASFARDTGAIHGSGPYTLESWEAGQRIVLRRKANWWAQDMGDANPRLLAAPDKLVFNIIPDPTTTANAIRDELVDAASGLDSRDFIDLRNSQMVSDRYEFDTPLANQLYFIGLNNQSPKLNDKRVRRALAHLVDIDKVINTLYDSLAEPVTGPFHPSQAYYHKELKVIPYDVERARTLLREAGWEDTNGNGTVDKQLNGRLTEFELEFLVVNASRFGNNLALLFQENARQAGIAVSIVPLEFRTMMGERVVQRQYELYGGAVANQPIPDDPYQVWHTDNFAPNGSNRVLFGNAGSDALIEQIRTTLDEQERNRLYRRFQEIIYEEQPMIFLFAPRERVVISRRFDAEATSLSPGYLVNEFLVYDLEQS